MRDRSKPRPHRPKHISWWKRENAPTFEIGQEVILILQNKQAVLGKVVNNERFKYRAPYRDKKGLLQYSMVYVKPSECKWVYPYRVEEGGDPKHILQLAKAYPYDERIQDYARALGLIKNGTSGDDNETDKL